MPLSILKFVLILTVSLCLTSCAISAADLLEKAETGMLPHERLTESNLLNFINIGCCLIIKNFVFFFTSTQKIIIFS